VDHDPAPAWPPPHPSPPLPPPREYGSPGTPPDRRRWLWAVLGAVAVVAVVTGALVALVRGPDDAADARTGPGGAEPTRTAASVASTSATPAGPPPYRCWDGTDAETLEQCSMPTGVGGLRWVFPHLAEQRCGRPTRSEPGVVLRVLCSSRFADGSRIQVGYYQWRTVRAGVAFYDAQELERSEDAGFHSWLGTAGGDTLKSALLYVEAPYSFTVTLPRDAKPTSADLQLLQPRAATELRGAPAG